MTGKGPAIVFDLDGTLVDSVYQDVIAWSAALQQAGLDLAPFRSRARATSSSRMASGATPR